MTNPLRCVDPGCLGALLPVRGPERHPERGVHHEARAPGTAFRRRGLGRALPPRLCAGGARTRRTHAARTIARARRSRGVPSGSTWRVGAGARRSGSARSLTQPSPNPPQCKAVVDKVNQDKGCNIKCACSAPAAPAPVSPPDRRADAPSRRTAPTTNQPGMSLRVRSTRRTARTRAASVVRAWTRACASCKR